MASTLTVETGSGSATADALVSSADCVTYATARGLTFTGTDTLLDGAIRRATAHLSAGYTWKGTKVQGRSQALAWPRVGVCDDEGWSVASDAVPAEVVQACCELAVYELANPGGLAPAVDLTTRLKRKKIEGLEWEYATPVGAEASRPVLTLVNDLLSGLLSGGSNSLVGTAVRA